MRIQDARSAAVVDGRRGAVSGIGTAEERGRLTPG
jgi:hypothetical protein